MMRHSCMNSMRRYQSADAGKTGSSGLPLRTLRPFGRFCILEGHIEIRFGFSALFVNHEMTKGWRHHRTFTSTPFSIPASLTDVP